LQISSSIVHKNHLFLDLNVHYLSKKQPKTYLYQTYVKFQTYLQMKKKNSYLKYEKKIIFQNGKNFDISFFI